MKSSTKGVILALIVTLLTGAGLYYFFLPVLNVKSAGMWFFLFFLLGEFAMIYEIACSLFVHGKLHKIKHKPAIISTSIIAVAFLILMVLVGYSHEFFHAKRYSQLLAVEEDCDFQKDLSETVSTDAIAIMDTDSAKMLGNRKIGSLSNLVSQYNVSEQYSQINYQNTPMKAAPLEYAGFFKYMKNKSNGIPGYVLVSPVDMSAEYVTLEKNMQYVPSAYFSKNLERHIRFHYPTKMIHKTWFEIDEEGNPYYIASVYDNTIGLFGGKDIVGAILINPINGEMNYCDAGEIPSWVDIVYDGDLLCAQYNYYGELTNGFLNSKFSATGCKITTDDYGYIAMNDDIWVYTGVTSVNSDASNIGFVLMNERTKEAKFYSIAGADEKSAMTAAEGEVQQYGYSASFPSLINIDGNATYIMVLKDSGGLVKMYAAVNAEQYNIVTTASDQQECIEKYRARMAKGGEEIEEQTEEPTENNTQAATATPEPTIAPEDYTSKKVTVKKLEAIDVDGNTYLYLLTEDGEYFHAKYIDVLAMMNVKEGDTITIEIYEDLFLYEEK